MAAPLFHVGAVALCPHGGQVGVTSSNSRVLVSGQPVATIADQYTVTGCTFSTPAGPQPCVQVRWTTPTMQTVVIGQPAVTAASLGLCIAANGAPNGPASIISTQLRVVAT